MKRIITVGVIVFGLVALGWFLQVYYWADPVQNGSLEDGAITGEVTCLPKKDTGGPVTLECALGLVADGDYYALANTPDASRDLLRSGNRVTVTGTLVAPDPDTTYDIVGTIEVETLTRAGASNASAADENQHTMTGGDIAFSRPDAFGLAVRPEHVLGESVVPPCAEGFDYCLYYNADTYADTNFESAGLRLVERAELTSESACSTTAPAGYQSLAADTHEEDAYVTSRFTPIQSAATGHSSEGAIYRLWYNDTCYEFETRIGVSQFENYEADTIEEFTDADRQALMAELQNALGEIRFARSGEAIVFPGQ